MPEENDGFTEPVIGVITCSQKDIVTCQEIKDSLTAQGIGLYSREAIIRAMESISDQQGREFKFIIVTRKGQPEFAIRKT